jgi:hypothetical protein
VTIVPLLSQTSVAKGVQGEPYKALVKRIQFGGDGQCRSVAASLSHVFFGSSQKRLLIL